MIDKFEKWKIKKQFIDEIKSLLNKECEYEILSTEKQLKNGTLEINIYLSSIADKVFEKFNINKEKDIKDLKIIDKLRKKITIYNTTSIHVKYNSKQPSINYKNITDCIEGVRHNVYVDLLQRLSYSKLRKTNFYVNKKLCK